MAALVLNGLRFALPAALTSLAELRGDAAAKRHWLKYWICLVPILLLVGCVARPLLASQPPHFASALDVAESLFLAWLGFAGGADSVFRPLSGFSSKYEAQIDAALEGARRASVDTARSSGAALIAKIKERGGGGSGSPVAEAARAPKGDAPEGGARRRSTRKRRD